MQSDDNAAVLDGLSNQRGEPGLTHLHGRDLIRRTQEARRAEGNRPARVPAQPGLVVHV